MYIKFNITFISTKSIVNLKKVVFILFKKYHIEFAL